MRLNKYLAQNTYLSRRQADEAIESARVTINSKTAMLGDVVNDGDIVTLDNKILSENFDNLTILINKPVGYVCSRNGQGSPTVYDLLPKKYENLNIAGRLDRDSSGLVILTSDGNLLYELTHPSRNKEKVYEIELDRDINSDEFKSLLNGVEIGDERPSKFKSVNKFGIKKYKVVLEEGRNRQIRRTVDAIGHKVIALHRLSVGEYSINNISNKSFKII